MTAGTSQAAIAPDGKVRGDGDIHCVGKAEFDLPHCGFMSGPMTDDMASAGGGMRGPEANPRDYTGERFRLIILPDNMDLDCRRREPSSR